MIAQTITSLDELQYFAKNVLKMLPGTNSSSTVIALSGDLGVGKTAFTKALAHELGIVEDITSPTFVIMKSYNIPHSKRFSFFVHVDAYRIEDENEMRVIKFDELLNDPKNLVVIEWPERISSLIPNTAFPVTITITEGEIREVRYGN